MLLPGAARAADAADTTDAFLTAWFEARGRIQTWSADFVQTRALATLREPLRTPGRLWFSAPHSFRWELGDPPQTVALRHTDELVVFYPRLKRAEKYRLDRAGQEPWRDALALLDAGFPSSRAELEQRFAVGSLVKDSGKATLSLEPRHARARQFLSEVRLEFEEPELNLVANEMRFSDGSVLRNDFANAITNPKLAESVFQLPLPEDVKIVEPMQR